jgi:hypothetical protein
MKKANTIEQYEERFRRNFLENWNAEVRMCRAWLDGCRDWHVGYLGYLKHITEDEVRQKLIYAESMVKNVDYYVRSHSYSYRRPQPRKDNDGRFTSDSESWAYSPRIRVPKLKRKSAWKRFYKMFPGLKGKETITGSSSCWYRDEKGEYRRGPWHYSTIKLKKVK